jgi:predicted Zn-ribbon and HTH transcriptional regulator
MDPIYPQTCLRCGYEWHPRSQRTPIVCPKCRSPYWNREREADKKPADDAK